MPQLYEDAIEFVCQPVAPYMKVHKRIV